MMFLPIQSILIIFLLFAFSRVYLQAKRGGLKIGELIFWGSLFAVAILGVIDPNFSNFLAQSLGIGRGVDVVLYMSIVLLFYLIFRTNVHLEETRHEITKLVREIALQDETKKKKDKS